MLTTTQDGESWPGRSQDKHKTNDQQVTNGLHPLHRDPPLSLPWTGSLTDTFPPQSNTTLLIDRNGCLPGSNSSSRYAYDTLPPHSNMIRLIDVEPDLDRVGGRIQIRISRAYLKKGGYRCLSYTWGYPGEEREILLNGYPFHVRQNLHEFLVCARQSFPLRSLWIDAMCINQEDLSERASQVGLMGEIFRLADEVLIWLGHSVKLQPLKKWLQSSHDSIYAVDAELSVSALAAHPYWNRLWVTQEILQGRAIQIIAGDCSIKWSLFVANVKKVRDLEPKARYGQEMIGLVPSSRPETRDAAVIEFVDEWSRRHYNDHTIIQHQSARTYDKSGIWSLLRWRGTAGCADIRDRIFGLLALVDLSVFPVSYEESKFELFWRAGEYFQAWSNTKHIQILREVLEISIFESDKLEGCYIPDSITMNVHHTYFPKRRYWSGLPGSFTCRFCNVDMQIPSDIGAQRWRDVLLCTAKHEGDPAANRLYAHALVKPDQATDTYTLQVLAPYPRTSPLILPSDSLIMNGWNYRRDWSRIKEELKNGRSITDSRHTCAWALRLPRLFVGDYLAYEQQTFIESLTVPSVRGCAKVADP
jgi:hypothetical protein